jgi:hypothetical protein
MAVSQQRHHQSPFPIDKSGNVDVAAYLAVLLNESSTCTVYSRGEVW